MNTPTPVRKRVLLIDDDEVIAGSLRSYLAANGCGVDVAVVPDDAETLMHAHRYDVVIVDPYLTGAIHGDNAKVLADIASLQPEASTIVLTAYASPELVRLAARVPATSLLTKPQSVVSIGDLVFTSTKGRSQ